MSERVARCTADEMVCHWCGHVVHLHESGSCQDCRRIDSFPPADFGGALRGGRWVANRRGVQVWEPWKREAS